MKNRKLFKDGEVFVKSMEELIKRYQKSIELGISKKYYETQNDMKCLLCNPLGLKKNHDYYHKGRAEGFCEFNNACHKMGCPWVVILGKTCTDFSYENKKMKFKCIYSTDDADIMKTRIRQIRNWIKIYNNHMETFKKD